MDNPKRLNDRLRRQRVLRGWSQQRLADELKVRFPQSGASAKNIGRWERGARNSRPSNREHLCVLFTCDAEALGFVEPLPNEDEVFPTLDEIDAQEEEDTEIGDPNMGKGQINRRTFLGADLAGGSSRMLPAAVFQTLTEVNSLGGGQHMLQQFESLNQVCWELSNNNQLDLVEQLLHVYLPRVSAIAHQSEQFRPQTASLVTRGFILAR